MGTGSYVVRSTRSNVFPDFFFDINAKKFFNHSSFVYLVIAGQNVPTLFSGKTYSYTICGSREGNGVIPN